MKTAEEKVQEFIDNNFGHIGAHEWSTEEYYGLINLIEEIRADQHEKTRQACAEAVNNCDDPALPSICRAYSACMNVKAV